MKTNLLAQFGIAHHLRDLLQDLLSRLVVRMGLAGKQELHRALGIVDHRGQALDVGEDQVGALVGGEAAREADGQRIGREHLVETVEDFLRLAAAGGLFVRAVPGEVEQLGLEAEMRFPKFAVVHVFDRGPGLLVAARGSASPTPRCRS